MSGCVKGNVYKMIHKKYRIFLFLRVTWLNVGTNAGTNWSRTWCPTVWKKMIFQPNILLCLSGSFCLHPHSLSPVSCLPSLDDLVVGAPMFMRRGFSGRLEELGKVYVYLQRGPLLLEPGQSHLLGRQPFSRFGTSLAPLGDLNQDGFNGACFHSSMNSTAAVISEWIHWSTKRFFWCSVHPQTWPSAVRTEETTSTDWFSFITVMLEDWWTRPLRLSLANGLPALSQPVLASPCEATKIWIKMATQVLQKTVYYHFIIFSGIFM